MRGPRAGMTEGNNESEYNREDWGRIDWNDEDDWEEVGSDEVGKVYDALEYLRFVEADGDEEDVLMSSSQEMSSVTVREACLSP